LNLELCKYAFCFFKSWFFKPISVNSYNNNLCVRCKHDLYVWVVVIL